MTKQKNTAVTEQAPRLFLDEGVLKDMIQTLVQQLLTEEVERHLGVGSYERSTERRGYRNGTKPRSMKTAVGKLEFKVPQVREGGFQTQIFERYQRSDKALVAAMQEMVVHGVSTRNVSEVMEKLGGFEVSAATVSRTMSELDGQIAEHFSRRLDGIMYPYLVVDARYEKVRRNGRVASQAVLVVAGIRSDGRRELLSLKLGDSESADTWGEVFGDLKRRGISGVELIVSDAHSGIRAAIGKHFQDVPWQRCKVHFMRELTGKVSYKDTKELMKDLRSIYASKERGHCLRTAEEVASKWDGRAPRLSKSLRDGVEDTLTAMSLLAECTERRLNSTNMMERAMKEIKKRTRQVGSFPNEKACWRLVGAVLLEMQDRWDVERGRYIIPEKEGG